MTVPEEPKLEIGQVVYVADGNKITAYRVSEIRNFITATGRKTEVLADAKASNRQLDMVGYFLTEAAARESIKARAKSVYDAICKEASDSPVDNAFIV